MDEPTDTIPWYKSQVLQGILVAMITHALVRLHIAQRFAPDQVAEFVNDTLDMLGFVYAASAAYHRVRSPLPPVAINKAAADAANTKPSASSTISPGASSP